MREKINRGERARKPIPLLLVGDHPTMHSGLARIMRELATRIASDAETRAKFRVAVLGKGGWGQQRALPFPCYAIPAYPATEWGQSGALRLAWEDWSGGERGVVMTVWDASRLLWFSRPEYCGDPELAKWLGVGNGWEGNPAPFARWGYFPVDSTGPNDQLTAMTRDTLQGYDRVLAYTRWAGRLVDRTLGWVEGATPALPHGLDTCVFRPRDRAEARRRLGIPDSAWLVGIVATNQARKDWGLALSVCAELRRQIPELYVWAHTDALERCWSLPALSSDLGLGDRLLVTGIGEGEHWTDEQMAWAYSACDLTLAPGLGEGWGFPIVESLACGVPVIHGDYGGGAELLPRWCRPEPVAYRIEGLHNCVRPVFRVEDWVKVALTIREMPPKAELLRRSVVHLDWNAIWPGWKNWLVEGVR